MNIFKTIVSKSSWTSLFIFLSTSNVFANHVGGHIVVGGSTPNPIPTLSGGMLVLLSLLLFVVALRISKQNNVKVNKFFMTLFGVIILSTSGNGFKLISEAKAGVLAVVALSSPSGGAAEKSFDLDFGGSSIGNNTGQPLLILRFESIPVDIAACSFVGKNDPCFGKALPFSMPAGTQCFVRCDDLRPQDGAI